MSPKAKDANFPVRIESPMGGDLLIGSVTGHDQMGRLFVFQLELLSENYELHFDNVVGKKVTTILELAEGERYFNGYITEFRYSGSDDRFAHYQATVRPWLWFLTRTADCKIFQEMKVPDIIKKVFKDNGMADFEDRMSDSYKYREWEYCVQYRESDFNFVSRLMEQEGIYYFFEHHKDKHVMVLADDIGAHKPFPKHATVPFHTGSRGMQQQFEDHVDTWTARQSIQPSDYMIEDFNFTTPNVPMGAKSTDKPVHTYPLLDKAEIFDYPGEYPGQKDGETYAEIRLQELKCQQERMQTGGSCRGFAAGCLFKLENYSREDQNKDYVVVSVEHHIDNTAFISGQTSVNQLYRCSVEVMKKEVPFRATRKTPKPMVQGPQSAIVVGTADEEIYTDEYGRVKVQFHWDRYGKSDQNSSCWIRVSQVWAGAKWGGIHIPRIGQEVIVSFMEGDPDRPIITGRVYNAASMPPYALEANKTQSGIKSRSTKGGGPDNFNEIRMEDKIDEEELYIQAEKNENILVKNNKGEKVGNNETISIGNDRKETVGHDETIKVKNDREETVDRDEELNVGNDRTRNVANDETVSIGHSKTKSVGSDETIGVGAKQKVDIGTDQTIGVGSDRGLVVGKNHSISVGKDETREIGKKLVIDVGDSILLRCGSASVSMKKNGDIKIEGKNLVLKSSAKITAKASGDIVLKGSKILEN